MVRIFQGTGSGTSFTQTGLILFKGVLTNGWLVAITGIDPTGDLLLVTVKDSNHYKAFVKVVVLIDCDVAIGNRYPTSRGYSRNSWIRLKVTGVSIDGDPVCLPTSSGHTGGSRHGYKKS